VVGDVSFRNHITAHAALFFSRVSSPGADANTTQISIHVC